jgi:hypothetical protein
MLPALLVYLLSCVVVLLAMHRLLLPLGIRSAAVLVLLPLTVTGAALLHGKIYAPVDISFLSPPLRGMTAASGVESVQNPALTDVAYLMIPWRQAVRDAFARGEYPLWNPHVFTGDILAAASEPAPLYPTNLLALLLPIDLSLTFVAAFTLFLAGVSAFVWSRELSVGEPGALFTAAAWLLSDYLIFFVHYPMGHAVALLPLTLLAARRLARDASHRSMLLLAIVLAVVVLAGHPESTLHIVIFGAIWFAFEFSRHRQQAYRKIALGLGAGAIALGLTAVFLLPVVDALLQTAEYRWRHQVGHLFVQRATVGEVAARLVPNVVPFVYGDARIEVADVPVHYPSPHSGYAGAILFALALIGFLRSRWSGRWLLFGMIVVGWLAAAGFDPLLRFLDLLPLFSIAINDRLIFGSVLALATLAGAGAEAALTPQWRSRTSLVTALTLLVLIVAVALLWGSMRTAGLSEEFLLTAATRELVPLLLVAAAAAAPIGARGLAAALLLFFLVSRSVAFGDFYPTLPRSAFYPRPPLLAALPADPTLYRIVGEQFTLIPNEALLFGLSDVRGFQGMTLTHLSETFPLWSEPQPVWFNRVDDLNAPLLSFMNVRYAIAPENRPVPDGWSVVAAEGDARLLRNSRALERAFIPEEVVIDAEPEEIFGGLRRGDLAGRSWIGSAAAGTGTLTPNGSGSVTSRYGRYGYRLDVALDAPAWVVVSETAWRGWRAFSADSELPVARANWAWLAVRVPAGEHTLRLVFRPTSFVAGGAITGATLVLLAAASLLRPGRRRAAAR